MAEARRGDCSVCGREGAVTADGGLRHHFTEDPEQQAGPDSRKCRGVGLPPAGSVSLPETGTGYVCRIPPGPEGCGRPVTLTSNGRSRSHLNNLNTACAGGSDWPLLVGKGGVRTDTAPDPHRQEAEAAMAEAGRIQDALDAGYEQSVQDGLTELRGLSEAKAVLAGDKPPATHTGNPSSHPSPYVPALERAVGDPGTVLGQLETDPRDATVTRPVETIGGRRVPETECAHDFSDTADDVDEDGQDRVVSVCRFCGRIAPEDLEDPRDEEPDRPSELDYVEGAEAPVFDVTHDFSDEASKTYGVHPGEAADCRLPGCCTHPRGFTYGDDGEGHSGSVCTLCGAPEPEPCTHPYGYSLSGPDGDDLTEEAARSTVRICMDCGAEEPDWRTPADLLARMPGYIQELAATRPECWDCGHEVTPLVERFEQSGNVRHVVWDCRVHCAHGDGHIGQPCRPRRSEQARLGDLDEGDHFTRHWAKAPLDRLVYRTGTPVTGPRSATVVSAGPHHGRTGTLTNLQEEITCTDEHGTPRVRRDPRLDPGSGATSLSSPVPGRSRVPTPSAPARPASSKSPGRGPGSTPPSPASAPGAGTSSTRVTASGPTGPAATSARTAGTRTALPDAFTTAKAAVSESEKYDNYGRYKLLHPDTGKKVKWTRATTFAKSVQDTFALSMWSQRMTLKGAAMRQDITAAVLTLDVKADKDRVNALVEDAKKAAGDKVAANKGTAVHAFTEDRDKLLAGEDVDVRPVPEEFVPTVEAYEEILRAFGLEPVPGLIEFTTAVKQYEVAGTSDRVYRVTRDITVQLNKRTVTLYAGEYVIGDVKTGADLSYGWQEIAIQLALYAQGINTSGVWDWGTGRWGKPVLPDNPDVLLKVRTDVGLVPHLPVDRATTGAPLATLYAVDLDAGWSAAVLCASVRTWRKERALATPLEIADVTGEVPQADPQRPVSRPAIVSRPVTLEDRAKAVTSRAEASSVFQEAKAARVTVAELNRLTEIMQRKLESFVEQGS